MRLLEKVCKNNLMLKLKNIKLTLMKYACILSDFFHSCKGKIEYVFNVWSLSSIVK